jgi:hypothetical protein
MRTCCAATSIVSLERLLAFVLCLDQICGLIVVPLLNPTVAIRPSIVERRSVGWSSRIKLATSNSSVNRSNGGYRYQRNPSTFFTHKINKITRELHSFPSFSSSHENDRDWENDTPHVIKSECSEKSKAEKDEEEYMKRWERLYYEGSNEM